MSVDCLVVRCPHDEVCSSGSLPNLIRFSHVLRTSNNF